MIVRSLDQVAAAERAGTPIQCQTCRQTVHPDELTDRGYGTPLTAC